MPAKERSVCRFNLHSRMELVPVDYLLTFFAAVQKSARPIVAWHQSEPLPARYRQRSLPEIRGRLFTSLLV